MFMLSINGRTYNIENMVFSYMFQPALVHQWMKDYLVSRLFKVLSSYMWHVGSVEQKGKMVSLLPVNYRLALSRYWLPLTAIFTSTDTLFFISHLYASSRCFDNEFVGSLPMIDSSIVWSNFGCTTWTTILDILSIYSCIYEKLAKYNTQKYVKYSMKHIYISSSIYQQIVDHYVNLYFHEYYL